MLLLTQLKLEFFERKKGRWLLPAETSNWEVWTLQINLIDPQSEEGKCVYVCSCVIVVNPYSMFTEWERHKEKLSTVMGETVSSYIVVLVL